MPDVLVIPSHAGVPIRLTEERWRHITTRHPEMGEHRAEVIQTLTEPDAVLRGDFGELLAVRECGTLSVGRYVVVVYREIGTDDGFVLTAYLADRVSPRREATWKR